MTEEATKQIRRRKLKKKYAGIPGGTEIDVWPHMYAKYVRLGLIDADEDDAELVGADLRELTVPQLRELCDERGLPRSGNKGELIERLQAPADNEEEE